MISVKNKRAIAAARAGRNWQSAATDLKHADTLFPRTFASLTYWWDGFLSGGRIVDVSAAGVLRQHEQDNWTDIATLSAATGVQQGPYDADTEGNVLYDIWNWPDHSRNSFVFNFDNITGLAARLKGGPRVNFNGSPTMGGSTGRTTNYVGPAGKTLADWIANNQFTAYLVGKAGLNSAASRILWFGDTGGFWGMGTITPAATNWIGLVSDNTGDKQLQVAASGNPEILEWFFTGGVQHMSVNGGADNTLSANNVNSVASALRLNGRWNTELACALIFKTALSAQDRQAMRYWLGKRFGITTS